MSYIPIASQTLTSAASSVTFSAIPQTFRDLIIVVSATGTVDVNIFMTLNGDTGSNYTSVRMFGTGSSALSSTDSARADWRISSNAVVSSTPTQNYIIQVFDYAQTDKHKTGLWRANSPTAGVAAAAGRYASTSNVTSFSMTTLNANTYAAGSVFSLYGIEG
jgi:hypothetical protein